MSHTTRGRGKGGCGEGGSRLPDVLLGAPLRAHEEPDHRVEHEPHQPHRERRRHRAAQRQQARLLLHRPAAARGRRRGRAVGGEQDRNARWAGAGGGGSGGRGVGELVLGHGRVVGAQLAWPHDALDRRAGLLEGVGGLAAVRRERLEEGLREHGGGVRLDDRAPAHDTRNPSGPHRLAELLGAAAVEEDEFERPTT